MIMIEIQYSGKVLLLLVNPHMLHQNACPSYINYHLKRGHFVASYVQPVIINNCLKITSVIKVAPMKIMDDSHY